MTRALFVTLLVLMAGPAFAGQNVTYTVGGGQYEGYLAKSYGPSAGLVVIVHDWDGLTGYEKKRAEMLAGMGYDAFAVDLYGKGNRPSTLAAKRAETGKLRKDRAAMRARMLGGLAEARRLASGSTVVMGYCFGGGAVLEMARSGQASGVRGYATFHGDLSKPAGESYPANTPPMLIEHGGADTSVKMSAVTALVGDLEKARIKYEIQVFSGTPHAFTVFGTKRYRKTADTQSWAAFSEFLKQRLGG